MLGRLQDHRATSDGRQPEAHRRPEGQGPEAPRPPDEGAQHPQASTRPLHGRGQIVGLLQAARFREAQVCKTRALDQELHAHTGALEADDPEKDLQGHPGVRAPHPGPHARQAGPRGAARVPAGARRLQAAGVRQEARREVKVPGDCEEDHQDPGRSTWDERSSLRRRVQEALQRHPDPAVMEASPGVEALQHAPDCDQGGAAALENAPCEDAEEGAGARAEGSGGPHGKEPEGDGAAGRDSQEERGTGGPAPDAAVRERQAGPEGEAARRRGAEEGAGAGGGEEELRGAGQACGRAGGRDDRAAEGPGELEGARGEGRRAGEGERRAGQYEGDARQERGGPTAVRLPLPVSAEEHCGAVDGELQGAGTTSVHDRRRHHQPERHLQQERVHPAHRCRGRREDQAAGGPDQGARPLSTAEGQRDGDEPAGTPLLPGRRPHHQGAGLQVERARPASGQGVVSALSVRLPGLRPVQARDLRLRAGAPPGGFAGSREAGPVREQVEHREREQAAQGRRDPGQGQRRAPRGLRPGGPHAGWRRAHGDERQRGGHLGQRKRTNSHLGRPRLDEVLVGGLWREGPEQVGQPRCAPPVAQGHQGNEARQGRGQQRRRPAGSAGSDGFRVRRHEHRLRPGAPAPELHPAGDRGQGRHRGHLPLLQDGDGDCHALPRRDPGRQLHTQYPAGGPLEHRGALAARRPLPCHHLVLLQPAGGPAGHHLHRQVRALLGRRLRRDAEGLHRLVARAGGHLPAVLAAGVRGRQLQRRPAAGQHAERHGAPETEGGDRGPRAAVRRHRPAPLRGHQERQHPHARGVGVQHAEVQAQAAPLPRRHHLPHLRPCGPRDARVPARQQLRLQCEHRRLHIQRQQSDNEPPGPAPREGCPLTAAPEVLLLAVRAGLLDLRLGRQGGLHLLSGQGFELQDALPEAPPSARRCSGGEQAGHTSC
mmetsp:Transcript_8981/g.24462  ORF Transcript_8981/g.24462 Transcript_8981/m.24462 type:complete len:940 (+) Transcript_8981:680-3499(+)